MLALRFGATDVAEVRFAISPLVELMRSVRALDEPSAHALHLPWIAEARERTRGLSLEVLRALQPPGVYSPDFINPPPVRPLVELEEELTRIARLPPDQIRAEVRAAYPGRRVMPDVLEPFLRDPARAVDDLIALLREYWARTLAAHWPRIRSVLDGDLLYRAREMTLGGARRLFDDIDPTVNWRDDILWLEKSVTAEIDLDGQGLLLVPSVFVWPRVLAVTDRRWQPALIYPARGVGLLWERHSIAGPEALDALLGRVRSALFAALDRPRSTTELARVLEISAGSASQHLRVLRVAGLVTRHRTGRVVLYMRTALGDDLLRGAP
jgi:DNA-binding transcriptional ArsR family regulator